MKRALLLLSFLAALVLPCRAADESQWETLTVARTEFPVPRDAYLVSLQVEDCPSPRYAIGTKCWSEANGLGFEWQMLRASIEELQRIERRFPEDNIDLREVKGQHRDLKSRTENFPAKWRDHKRAYGL